MPEGPEIRRMVDDIHKAVGGKTAQSVFFAFEHLCPHQMHPLSEAQITAFGEVVCPLHAYRFHLQTGSEANQKCRDLKTFEVEIRQEGVFINLY